MLESPPVCWDILAELEGFDVNQKNQIRQQIEHDGDEQQDRLCDDGVRIGQVDDKQGQYGEGEPHRKICMFVEFDIQDMNSE